MHKRFAQRDVILVYASLVMMLGAANVLSRVGSLAPLCAKAQVSDISCQLSSPYGWPAAILALVFVCTLAWFLVLNWDKAPFTVGILAVPAASLLNYYLVSHIQLPQNSPVSIGTLVCLVLLVAAIAVAVWKPQLVWLRLPTLVLSGVSLIMLAVACLNPNSYSQVFWLP